MFLHSKTFRFLLPLCAFVLFFVLWALNYVTVWYANIPEETELFRKPAMAQYLNVAYLLALAFGLFLGLGVAYLRRERAPKALTYGLAATLFLAAYFVWVYSVSFVSLRTNKIFLFLDLCLFGWAIGLLLSDQRRAATATAASLHEPTRAPH